MITTRFLIIIFLFFASFSGCAQVQIISTEKLQLPESGKFYHPRLDNSGSLLLLTSENYKGLKLYNLKNKEMMFISEEDGAGYSAVISDDGETVLFTQNEYIGNRLYTGLMAYHVPKGVTDHLAPAARELSMISATKGQLAFQTDGQLKTATISSGISALSGIAGVDIEDRKLMVYTGNQAKKLDPFENESYIWPSVSPGRTQILAYAMGKGAFICDMEGKLIKELGNIEAPVWVTDDYITGMITKSDGHQILAAEIVILNVHSGKKLSVSPRGVISMYPSVSGAAHKIAFHSSEGEIYLISFDLNP
jgi:hypothetical protein